MPDLQPLTPTEFRGLACLLSKSKNGFESTIAGVSMAPAIPNGARIRIRPLNPADYRVGQVVACATGNNLFVHRIVYAGDSARTRTLVVTKGDGWMLCDSPTRRSEIVGLVTDYVHEGDWRPLTRQASGTRLNQAIGRASLMLIWPALFVHHGLARRIAGTCLVLGSYCKKISTLRITARPHA